MQPIPPPAIKISPSPRPFIPAVHPPDKRFDWVLSALLSFGFIAMLVLPSASAWALGSARTSDWLHVGPFALSLRTTAFFLAVFGGWGFVLYLWSCCVYSISKGQSWMWGLLSLFALIEFACLLVTGKPACGLVGVLGLGGFLVPMSMPADRVLLAAAGSVSRAALVKKLATHSTWIWAFGLFVGASIAYGNSFRGEMTLDNKYIIEEYFKAVPRILPNLDLFSWKTMVPLFFQNDYWWPKGISGLYRPAAVFTYWLNYATNHAMGNDPLDTFQFHVVNFVFHWFTAYLGFILIRQLTGRASVAFFAALLFVTHPIATESVSNIIGRSDILAATAVFACLILYIKSTKPGPWRIGSWLSLFITTEAIAGVSLWIASELSAPTWFKVVAAIVLVATPIAGFFIIKGAWKYRWTRLPWLGAILAVLTIGLFSKESAIAVVGAIIAYDVIYIWTLEDLRCAVPSLLLFSLLSAGGAIIGLFIGQFGALGLSEGLTPALIILLVGSLLSAGVLVLAGAFWVLSRPLDLKQVIEPWTKYFLPYAIAIPPIVIWLLARRWVFANASPPETPFLDNPIRGLGFFAARMTASDVFLRLLGLLVWPLKLSSDYSFNQIPLFDGHPGSGETWLALAGCLTIIAVLVLSVLYFRRNKLVCFLLLFYLIVYLPTSNFLIVIGSIMAERFLYLPLLAFVAFLVLGVEALSRRIVTLGGKKPSSSIVRPAVVYALLCSLALAYSVRAWFRNDDWHSDITLWTSAAKISPHSFRSYQSLAYALYEQLQRRDASGFYRSDPQLREEDIDVCYETAVQAKPIVDPLPLDRNSSRLYLHLGMYYSVKGVTDGHFAQNGSLLPGDPAEKWFRLAEQALQQGVQIDRAFNDGNRVKELKRRIHKESEISEVGLPPVYACLAADYGRLGEWQKSLQAFQYMQHLEPIDADAYVGIATAYSNMGRPEPEAIALLQALILDNKRTELWNALGRTFSAINQTGAPAITMGPGQRVELHIEVPEVRSVLCSAYQGLVRTFLLARRDATAEQFRQAAITQWKFSSDLFDNLVGDAHTESPVPPPPD